MSNQVATLFKPSSPPRQDTRDYLIGMIGELYKLARCGGEIEIAIHLKAILDASRLANRARRD